MSDYYQLLGLDRNATPQDVRDAFEQKKREILQRLGNTPEAQTEGQKLIEAAQTLYDPAKRVQYDRTLQAAQPPAAPVTAAVGEPPAPVAPPAAETPADGEEPHTESGGYHGPREDIKHEKVKLSRGQWYHLDDFLHLLVQRQGSDCHLKAGEPPFFRIHGNLARVQELPVLESEDIRKLMYGIMNEERQRRFETNWELDMSYWLPGIARFRVNVFQEKFNVAAVLRLIPMKVKTLDEWGFPEIFKELAMRPRGLFLVTGPTGCGKSTTLASIVDHINRHRRGHIITIEDPIEFVHEDRLCAVEQREIGVDTKSFAEALRHVMRQNPDVILVGEMRDLETISLAITAAETGHLVFATLHTTDTVQTVDRIIDVFPPDQQEQIRTQLAVTLLCIVSQQLLPIPEGGGRIAAFEIMVCAPAIRNQIREQKTHQIPTIMQASRELGMISLDEFLIGLLRQKKVTWEHAVAKSSSPADLLERARREGLVPANVGGEVV